MNKESENKVIDLWKSINVTETPSKQELQLEVVNQIASAFAMGKYYYMVLNFNTLQLEYVSPEIKDFLGFEAKDFSFQTFFSILHPEDLTQLPLKEAFVIDFLTSKIPPEDIPFYKTIYMLRERDLDGNYKTVLHQIRVISISDDGQIQQGISIHSDVTFLNIPFTHNISFVNQKKQSFFASEKDGVYSFIENKQKNIFTSREMEVLINLSEGKNFKQIAEILFVSPNTINHHKKNLLKKSNCNNTAELIAKSIREGII